MCSAHIIFFFLMIRRPPRSTLFPYTTALPICRSSPRPGSTWPADGDSDDPSEAEERDRRARSDNRAWGRFTRNFVVDRKSTRLNSSHANISYAVFCLKKKKKQIYTIMT